MSREEPWQSWNHSQRKQCTKHFLHCGYLLTKNQYLTFFVYLEETQA